MSMMIRLSGESAVAVSRIVKTGLMKNEGNMKEREMIQRYLS